MEFDISLLSRALDAELQRRIDGKAKPLGSLGQIECTALRIGRIQQTLKPELSTPRFIVFAADHGASVAGISAAPRDVTWQMVENFLSGGAAINVFARANGIPLCLVDAGVAHEFGPRENLVDAKINPAGTRNYLEEPAMTATECEAAIEWGANIARGLVEAGCRFMGFGEMGIGNTASASLITHCLIGTPLDECVGRGTGLDDAGLARTRELLASAVRRANLTPDADVKAVLREFGGFEIVMMTGAMLAAAERGATLLIDGFIATASLLAASRIAPAICDYCIFAHHSAEPGHASQLAALGAEALIDMGMRLGEGTGAALAWPLVQAAVAMLDEMASFESAGVAMSDK
ncbi:MAG: nicotinate-nucleotide--dimethylbenzimidazole phosphoribosyltransferase [Candidatus Accumulibacter sp.]|jgi:nicotinate-nucleotide--dimethylbenzimidazole phosphoribosyltransferase|nr:nicotinate-nucleotide--dimethylbenzimidazole phosphoribosyltransferase [Accumulibacter sp.]